MTRRIATSGTCLLLAICIGACGSRAASDGGSTELDATADIAHGDASDAVDVAHDVSSADVADSSGQTDAAVIDIAPLDTGPKLGCGDNLCTSPETMVTCPADCKKPICGDGFCQKPESGVGCPLDCAPATLAELACVKKLCPSAVSDCAQDVTCAGVLGSALDCASSAGGDAGIIANCAQSMTLNAKCSPLTASSCGFATCAGDAVAAICGDGLCQPTESSASCGYDCLGVAGKCGDGVCTGSETSTTCPADCNAAVVCGNGKCEAGENSANCPADCPVIAVCGDGICDAIENTSNCALDCDATLKAKADCLRASCGGEFDVCMPDPVCLKAITAEVKCVVKCASGDILCIASCNASTGNPSASNLATCGATNCP